MDLKKDSRLTQHTDIYGLVESCVKEKKRLYFMLNNEKPIISKGGRVFVSPSINISEINVMLDWMHQELEYLRTEYPGINPFDVSPDLLNLAVLLKPHLFKNDKVKGIEKHVTATKNKLLKIFLNHNATNLLVEENPSFANFIWNSQWYLLASKFNHTFVQDADDVYIQCGNQRLAWKDLKVQTHADGKPWITKEGELNGMTIVESGLIVHDSYNSTVIQPHKSIVNTQNLKGYTVEVMVATKKERTLLQKGDHTWIRLYNYEKNEIYSFGRYGPLVYTRGGLGPLKVNLLKPLDMQKEWKCGNYDRYERFVFPSHTWALNSKQISVTETQFQDMLNFISTSQKSDHTGSYTVKNCSHFVQEVLNSGNIPLPEAGEKLSTIVFNALPKRIRRISDNVIPKKIKKVVAVIFQVIGALFLMFLGHFKAEAEAKNIPYNRSKVLKKIFTQPNSITILTPKAFGDMIAAAA